MSRTGPALRNLGPQPAGPVAAPGAPNQRPAPPVSMREKVLESKLANFSSATICSLTTLLDLRDLSTGTHATRLAEWATRVGELAGLEPDEVRDLEVACLMHDVGKVGLADAILSKPGPLDDEEWEQMKKHPEMGWAILRLLPGFERISLLVLHHHERLDGAGYPGGLEGDEIPLGARIVAVVDAFDAMVSDRPYRSGLTVAEALGRLEESSGTQFDPWIVELFLSVVEGDLGRSEQRMSEALAAAAA